MQLNNGQEILGTAGRSGVDINAVNALNIIEGSSDIKIGIIDTGIDYNHKDLAGHIDLALSYDFVNDDATVFDSANEDTHGTNVAGVLAKVAPKSTMVSLKAFSDTTAYTSDIIDAIDYAYTNGIKIINCSFGGFDNNQALKDAMQNSGMLFVCSAGNGSRSTDTTPVYPACFGLPNILSVNAIDSVGQLDSFSNYGSTIDIAAPGVNILTAAPGNLTDYKSGTSMSAPFVTGIAALLMSTLLNFDYNAIKDRMIADSVKCTSLTGKTKTGGRLDGFAVLSVKSD